MGDAEKQSAEEEDDGCGLGHGGCFVYELVCLIDRLTFLATMKLGVCLYRGIVLLGILRALCSIGLFLESSDGH
jgi:hypothetical protein